jgi:hypothetical protein
LTETAAMDTRRNWNRQGRRRSNTSTGQWSSVIPVSLIADRRQPTQRASPTQKA